MNEYLRNDYLTSVSKLQALLPGEKLAYSEYGLTPDHPVESIQQFGEFFLDEDSGKIDENTFVWTDEQAFIARTERGPRFQGVIVSRYLQLQVFLSRPKDSLFHYFLVFAPTFEDAVSAMQFLLSLSDKVHDWVSVWGKDEPLGNQCPLDASRLEILLSPSEQRTVHFREMVFSPEQSRVLATRGVKLGFSDCTFTDGGIEFLESFTHRAGLKRVSEILFYSRNPFDLPRWRLFLQALQERDRLDRLAFCFFNFDTNTCTALAAVSVQKLVLSACRFADHGDGLIDSVAAGRGPRGLSFDLTWERRPFESAERWAGFAQALASTNCHLECLSFSEVGIEDAIWRSLASGIRQNQSLCSISINQVTIGSDCWEDFVLGVANHRSLRSLSFQRITFYDVSVEETVHKRFRTRVIARMLQTNHHMEEIEFVENLYDRKLWLQQVAPRLEYNRYREDFSRIQNIPVESTRAAVLGRALFRLRERTSLMWILLSQNQSIVASYQLAR